MLATSILAVHHQQATLMRAVFDHMVHAIFDHLVHLLCRVMEGKYAQAAVNFAGQRKGVRQLIRRDVYRAFLKNAR